MFSYRYDKVGFFSGLTLIILSGGTFIATLVLLIVGAVLDDFQRFLWPIRWVLCGWWLGCIFVVLLRVYILNWQMQRRRQARPDTAAQPEAAPAASLAPLSPEAVVARAPTDQERNPVRSKYEPVE
jgi:hypothetical protein